MSTSAHISGKGVVCRNDTPLLPPNTCFQTSTLTNCGITSQASSSVVCAGFCEYSYLTPVNTPMAQICSIYPKSLFLNLRCGCFGVGLQTVRAVGCAEMLQHRINRPSTREKAFSGRFTNKNPVAFPPHCGTEGVHLYSTQTRAYH